MKQNTTYLEPLSKERREKAKIIALINNKGGCGKTSTAVGLGMYLMRTGHNVLFVDCDPQSNMTQRLGLPDNELMDKRINMLFKEADVPGIETERRKLVTIIEYPYIFKLGKFDTGVLGLLAGSHDAESEANSTNSKLNRMTFSKLKYSDIYAFFKDSIQFYKSYFDYIILDTSPSLEGNILNKIAVRTVDEIVIPIDGIEASLGMRTLLSWIKGENKDNAPNITLAMVKYQNDIKKIDESLRMRNSVFRVIKDTFKEYVCDKGVRETATARNVVPGFRGSKTDYNALSAEIVEKITTPRQNLFATLTSESFIPLEEKILVLQAKAQKKLPIFKNPLFEAIQNDK